MLVSLCFFVKQMSAYEMRISDCSSDVCSSDRRRPEIAHLGEMRVPAAVAEHAGENRPEFGIGADMAVEGMHHVMHDRFGHAGDRQSVVSGKSVAVRLDPGGRRFIKKKIKPLHSNSTQTPNYNPPKEQHV